MLVKKRFSGKQSEVLEWQPVVLMRTLQCSQKFALSLQKEKHEANESQIVELQVNFTHLQPGIKVCLFSSEAKYTIASQCFTFVILFISINKSPPKKGNKAVCSSALL